MARGRPDVGEVAQPRLNPQASPVNSYVHPNAGAGLREIANALGDLSPALQRFATRQIEEEKERGRTDAASIYEDIKSKSEKIKTGEIAAHESRYYRAAAKEQVGRLLAASYGQDLQLAAHTDESLSESTDPADFDQFEAAHRKQWMEQHIDGSDESLLTGFNPQASQGILNARQSFVSAAANRLDGQVLDNTYLEHQLTIRDGITGGKSVEEIATDITQRNANFYLANPKLGPDKAGRSLNRTTIEAVFDAARSYEDPELLKILDHIAGGVKGSSLGMTRQALSKRDDVEREIRVNRQNRLVSEEKDEKRKRRDVVDSVYDDAIGALESNPDADVKAFADRLSTVDRTEVSKLYKFAAAFKGPAAGDDEGVAHGLYERAFDGDLSFSAVADAFTEGTITVKTAKALRAQVRQGRTGQSSKALIQDPVFTAFARDLDNMWVRHMGEVPGARGVYSQQQLRREWVSWKQSTEGVKASEMETLDWLQDRVQRNFMRFAADGGVPEIVDLVKGSPKPDATRQPARGPTIPKWDSEEVVPWREWDLEGFAREWSDVKSGRRSKLSATAEGLVTRYGIKGADMDRFIQAQRDARAAKK